MVFVPVPSGRKTSDPVAKKLGKDAGRVGSENTDRIDKLEAQIEKLSLVSEALWDIVQTELKCDEQRLFSKIKEVEARRESGKDKKLSCLSCRMLNSSSKSLCIYCGGALEGGGFLSPFE